jgi:3',5'-cyclic AMP phosphodiesterase CpdA
MPPAPRLTVAHLSDLHVGHVTSNLSRLRRLLLPSQRGEGVLDLAVRLVGSSWKDRRSLLEPLLRSAHLLHRYQRRNLVALLESVRAERADHVVLTGDIANLGAASELREAMQVLRDFGYGDRRLTVVPGNHDVINFAGTGDFRRLVRDRAYPHLDRIDEQTWVVAVDSTAHGEDLDWRDAVSLNARGFVRLRDVEQVDRLLASVPQGSFKILCCHHHLVDLPADGYVDDLSGRVDRRLLGKAENADALLDVAVARGVGLILFGHRHRATHDRFTIRSIPAACSGSVTIPDARGMLRWRAFELEGASLAGCRWVEVAARRPAADAVAAEPEQEPASGGERGRKVVLPLDAGALDARMSEVRRLRDQMDRELLERMLDEGKE